MLPHRSPSTRATSLLLPSTTQKKKKKTNTALKSLLDRPQSKPTSDIEHLCLLRTCRETLSLSSAKRIQILLSLHGFDRIRPFSEDLLATLCKCGAFHESLVLFNKLCIRSVFVWTAILSCYTDNGHPKEAITLYKHMRKDGVSPDSYTFVVLFKACGLIRDLDEGKLFHAEARSRGFCSDLFVGNTLISMYGKCGSLSDCERTFLEMSSRDIVSCNALLSAYVDQGLPEKALLFYRQIHEEEQEQGCLGLCMDEHTFVFTLRATRIYAESEEGYFIHGERPFPMLVSREIALSLHADARKRGFTCNKFIGNTLVSVYANCGSVTQAMNAFCCISDPDLVSWTALLSAFFEQCQPEKALQLYIVLPQDELATNHQTFLIALQACGSLAEAEEATMIDGQLSKPRALSIGRGIHMDTLALGLGSSLFVGNTLISMYGKCGSILDAANVFAGLCNLDVVTWNAMLSAYVEQGEAKKALLLYRQMQEENMSPNRQTFMTIIQACYDLLVDVDGEENATKAIFLKIGKALHSSALKRSLASDVFVGTTLIKMYSKCENVCEAENVFQGLCYHDIVSCTALLSVYVDRGEDEKAILFYGWMEREGISSLDDVTFIYVLLACRKTGRMELCRHIHFIMICGELETRSMVGSTLLHVNGGLGSMSDAKAIFNGLVMPDMAAWNAYMAGYAGVGNSEETLKLFGEMHKAEVLPDGSTFASLLSACNHHGVVDLGANIFASMGRLYGLNKDINHFVLWVDLLGRAGDFVRAQNAMGGVPKHAILAVSLCLMSASRTHGNIEVAKFAFNQILGLKSNDAAAYVLMSNMCVDVVISEAFIPPL